MIIDTHVILRAGELSCTLTFCSGAGKLWEDQQANGHVWPRIAQLHTLANFNFQAAFADCEPYPASTCLDQQHDTTGSCFWCGAVTSHLTQAVDHDAAGIPPVHSGSLHMSCRSRAQLSVLERLLFLHGVVVSAWCGGLPTQQTSLASV